MPNDYCKNCKKENHCCVFEGRDSGFVFVGIKDAEKIRRFTKKKYSDFLNFKKLSKKFINGLKNEDPSLEGYMRYKQTKDDKILTLKTKENGECIFLNKNKKCDIYKVRPNICNMYPYWAIILKCRKSPTPKNPHILTHCKSAISEHAQELQVAKVSQQFLPDGKFVIINHDHESSCNYLKKEISIKEKYDLINTFKKIKSEEVYYKKNIKKIDKLFFV